MHTIAIWLDRLGDLLCALTHASEMGCAVSTHLALIGSPLRLQYPNCNLRFFVHTHRRHASKPARAHTHMPQDQLGDNMPHNIFVPSFSLRVCSLHDALTCAMRWRVNVAPAPAKQALSPKLTAVGFEPTPLRTGALSQRLRPLGQTVLCGLEGRGHGGVHITRACTVWSETEGRCHHGIHKVMRGLQG